MSDKGLFKTLTVSEVIEEVKGFKTFRFTDDHTISYKAGQYLTFVYDDNGEEVRRSYSIVSTPGLNELLSVGIKRIPNGRVSRFFVDRIKPGDQVITTGAGGFFILPDDINQYQQLFFFAAGSGITPVFSLIKAALHFNENLRVVLIYSSATSSKTVFLEELRFLREHFPSRFFLEFLFSDSADLARARLYSDLLLGFVKEFSLASSGDTLFYICGPESYMRMCTYVLQQEGIPKENIRKENFVVTDSRRPIIVEPPDKNTRKATIRYGADIFEFDVAFPDAVLKAARKKGIDLPYSCEVGRCGNCVARCVKGKIWHSYNEVLTEKELAKGLVLTCVGHPVGDDVELVIE